MKRRHGVSPWCRRRKNHQDKGYGVANVEWGIPVQLRLSGFCWGSIRNNCSDDVGRDGKVGLDDSVRKYFPDAPETWNNITVRNLLTHTSGLGEYESDERTKPSGPFYLRLDFTEQQLYENIAAMPLDFNPCERWTYRNTNYVLLGMLIHRVTGESYGDFLQSRIFKPLGMTSTRIISEGKSKIRSGFLQRLIRRQTERYISRFWT